MGSKLAMHPKLRKKAQNWDYYEQTHQRGLDSPRTSLRGQCVSQACAVRAKGGASPPARRLRGTILAAASAKPLLCAMHFHYKPASYCSMSYVTPSEVVDHMLTAGRSKLACGRTNMLLRSSLAAGILSLAVCLAVTTSVQTGVKLYGALIFPTGFVILILLGLDLVTGNFALAPLPILNRESTTIRSVFRNWTFVFAGNLLGSLLIAALVATSMTMGFSGSSSPEADVIKSIAVAKTQGYAALGASGMLVVIVRAILCNWMVTLGVVLGMTSKNTGGKILAMWLPIMMFFGLGYEHAVVNMFVIPLGMILGADVTWAEWWLWNQIPVTIGNMLGGMALTGAALYAIHAQPLAAPPRESHAAAATAIAPSGGNSQKAAKEVGATAEATLV